MDLEFKLMHLSLMSGLMALVSLAFDYPTVADAFLALMFVLIMVGMAVGLLTKP